MAKYGVAIQTPFFVVVSMFLVWSASTAAVAQSVQRGRLFARTNCAKCHSVEKFGRSPLSIAPPFRTLHRMYPVEELEEALVEGIVTGHPSMPEFVLDPGQVADLLAYLKTLK